MVSRDQSYHARATPPPQCSRTSQGRRSVAEAILSRTVGPPGGPDVAERSLTGVRTVAIAKNLSGRALSEVQVAGPNVYDLTAKLMAWGAEMLANDKFIDTGVVSPIRAFGFDELREDAMIWGSGECDES